MTDQLDKWKTLRDRKKRQEQAALEAIRGRVLPPMNEDVERSALAAICWSVSARAIALEHLQDEDFGLPYHLTIFRVIRELAKENRQIDALTIKDRLNSTGMMVEANSEAYVDEVLTTETSGLHIDEYMEILKNNTIKRKLHALAIESLGNVHAGGLLPNELLDSAQLRLNEIKDAGLPPVDAAITIESMFAQAEPDPATGLIKPLDTFPTGFDDIDDLLDGGVSKGQYCTVAAETSVGKSAFAYTVAEHLLFNTQHRPAVFSLELTNDESFNRLFAMRSGVPFGDVRRRKWKDGSCANTEWDGMMQAARSEYDAAIHEGRFHLEMVPAIDGGRLRAKIQRLQRLYGIDYVIIDYLQKMSAYNTKGQMITGEYERCTEASSQIQRTALDLQIPIMMCCQLNRDPSRRANNEPVKSDLRGSGTLEQDSHILLMLYDDNPTVDANTVDKNAPRIVRCKIAKNKNGRTTQGNSNPKIEFRGWQQKFYPITIPAAKPRIVNINPRSDAW